MGVGKLKMWNANRGYGFIADEAGGPDMFLHIGELKTAGIDPDTIKVGDRLTFEVTSTRDGNPTTSATDAAAHAMRKDRRLLGALA